LPRPSNANQFSGSSILARSSHLSTIHALIIGINDYPEIDNLEGAVPDALALNKYLKEDLGVPASQIRLLLNADAARSSIIQEFNKLAADERINRGDPIVIFYAGHGGEVDAPKNWEAGDTKIQMLIPHDFRTTVDGQIVHGIPDRTIGTLLSHVAEKRGNNIVCLPEPHNKLTGLMGFYMYRQSSSTVVTPDLAHVLYQNPVVLRGSLRYQMTSLQTWT
jgi:Caspase domain